MQPREQRLSLLFLLLDVSITTVVDLMTMFVGFRGKTMVQLSLVWLWQRNVVDGSKHGEMLCLCATATCILMGTRKI